MPAAGDLRRPFFVVAVLMVVLIVLAEVGLSFWLGNNGARGSAADGAMDLGVPPGVAAASTEGSSEPPGAGIGFLALMDGLLLFTLLMLGLSLIVPLRTYGRVQGVVTLIVSLLWMLMCVLLVLPAVVKLLLMIGLFVAAPFGTLAYLAIWGGFPTGAAAAVLALILVLKVGFGVSLVLSQPRFLRVKGLVILVALSVVLQLVLGLIHGFLPGPVVAIGDQFWAIIIGIVALIWALIMLIGSIPAIVNAIRVSGSITDQASAAGQ